MKIKLSDYSILNLVKHTKDSAIIDINKLDIPPQVDDFLIQNNLIKPLADILSTPNLPIKVFSKSIILHVASNDKLSTQLIQLIFDIKDQQGFFLYNKVAYVYYKHDSDFFIFAFIHYTLVKAIIVKDPKDKDLLISSPNIISSHSNPSKLINDPSSIQLLTSIEQYASVISHLILPFLEYADIETKIINASTNHKTILNSERYTTDIKSNISIIDSSWYTNLIVHGDFNVSGHFRLQPYGPHNSLRKLIYIKDFTKHSYIRKAKILKQ